MKTQLQTTLRNWSGRAFPGTIRSVRPDQQSRGFELIKSSSAVSAPSGFVALAAMLFLTATGARADLIVLPGADSYEYFGFNFAENIQTSSTVGTLTYTGGLGCGGTCIATTQLGSDPFASLNVNEVVFDNTSGGNAQALLGYYVEYANPTPGTYTVNLHAPENLSITAADNATAYLGFGPAGNSPGSFNDFASYTLQEEDCVNGCATGRPLTPAPFTVDHSVQMVASQPGNDHPYFIMLDVQIDPGATGQQLTGFIDPQFSTTATGGFFAYSPGVTDASATPEPGVLVLMLSGFALLGGLRRYAFGFAGKRGQTH